MNKMKWILIIIALLAITGCSAPTQQHMQMLQNIGQQTGNQIQYQNMRDQQQQMQSQINQMRSNQQQMQYDQQQMQNRINYGY